VTGELTAQAIFDATAVTPVATNSSIERIRGYLIGFTGLVEFDATTNVPVMDLPSNDPFDFSFREWNVNGIPNNAGAGKTGSVLLTTTGFTAVGDTGWLEITVRKY